MTDPSNERRIAVLSDIHGNNWALRRVLEDIERRGVREMVNLGDCAYGPLDPRGAVGLLIAGAVPTVRGNEDRILFEEGEGASPTAAYTIGSLDPPQIDWLRSLPSSAVHGGCFMCHGTPASDRTYLLTEVSDGAVRPRDRVEVAADLSQVREPVVLCGHDHLPGTVSLPGGRTVVNPGSVGLQAYTDDQPEVHAVEAGSPHARYCVLVLRGTGCEAEHIEVAYDWDRAAAAAESNGRQDWAHWLRSGRAR